MQRTWDLMSAHGLILYYLSANPELTVRQLSLSLRRSQWHVSQVIQDLADAGMITITRNGRRNRYSLNHNAHLRHPALAHLKLGPLIETLQQPAAERAEATAAG